MVGWTAGCRRQKFGVYQRTLESICRSGQEQMFRARSEQRSRPHISDKLINDRVSAFKLSALVAQEGVDEFSITAALTGFSAVIRFTRLYAAWRKEKEK